jgi:hypothetical protein
MSFDSTALLKDLYFRLNVYANFFGGPLILDAATVAFEGDRPVFWFSGEQVSLAYPPLAGPIGGFIIKFSKFKVAGKFPIGVVADGVVFGPPGGNIRFYPNEDAKYVNDLAGAFVSVKGKLPLNRDHQLSIAVWRNRMVNFANMFHEGDFFPVDLIFPHPDANEHQKKGHILRMPIGRRLAAYPA